MYAKQLWPLLVDALQAAQAGDGTGFRLLADFFYARNPDGTYDPGGDRYFLITAADQRYQRGVDLYLQAGDESWGLFDHAWWNAGYVELNYGLYNPHSNSVYRGPFGGAAAARAATSPADVLWRAAPHGGIR